MKIDYSLKSKIFELEESDGILTIYNKYRRYRYCVDNGFSYAPLQNVFYIDTLCDMYAFHFAFNPEYAVECEKILNANRARSYRLRKKIYWMLLYCPAVTFCTLTFKESYLASTSPDTRRQNVSRFFASLNAPFIANVDYGGTYGREHYHAVVGCLLPKSALQEFNSHYGNIDVKRVRFSRLSCLRLSKYVSKLANHAVKTTACRNALLYSRKCPIPSGAELTVAIDKAVALDLVRATSCVSNKNKYRVIKSPVKTNKMVTKYCSCCGQLIVDYELNLDKYKFERLVNGKEVLQYFCEDCMNEYNIKK